MITFILIFVGILVVFAGWMIANGANQRKRSRQASASEVHAQQEGGGAPTTGRPTGVN